MLKQWHQSWIQAGQEVQRHYNTTQLYTAECNK